MARRKVRPGTYTLDEGAQVELEHHPEAWSAVEQCLLLEQGAHKAGWITDPNTMPWLFAITVPWTSTGDDAEAMGAPSLRAGLRFVAIQHFDGDYGKATYEFGRRMLDSRWEEGVRFLPLLPPMRKLYGLAHLTEGWGVHGMSSDDKAREVEQYADAGGRLVDHPDRQETRALHLVTSTGTSWMIMRPRGERPTVSVSVHEMAESWQWTGNVPRGLALLYNAIAENPVPVPEPRLHRG